VLNKAVLPRRTKFHVLREEMLALLCRGVHSCSAVLLLLLQGRAE
jgi:hypothetical protein